jgi:hypothetical protein
MLAATVMADFYRPVAAGLASLQASTVDQMLMPNVLEIRMGQFESLKRYVSIYDGNARVWTWETVTLQVPDRPENAEDFKGQLRRVLAGETVPTLIERPTIELADSEYLIQRPIGTK